MVSLFLLTHDCYIMSSKLLFNKAILKTRSKRFHSLIDPERITKEYFK